jgi:hypothetical protein
MKTTRAPRRPALLGAMVAASLVAGLLVTAQPASAVPTLHRVPGPSSPIDSDGPKTARAECPAGERVLGGGGSVVQNTNIPVKGLTLTKLRPVHVDDREHPRPGLEDYYEVTGSEVGDGTGALWFVTAYALCANPDYVPGLHIISKTTLPSSQPRQATATDRCPSWQRVIGSGAEIHNPRGRVSLQVARASGPGDIARAQAHEDVRLPEHTLPWSVTAYAVCANTPPGYKVVFEPSEQEQSEERKFAFADCPADGNGRPTFVHGAGAAVTNVAPGNIGLTQAVPFSRSVFGEAREHTSTPDDWDFIAAAICAY